MPKKRLVIKIGSSSLTEKNGELSYDSISQYAKAAAALKNEGHEVILISSGAVAAGFTKMGYPVRPVTTAGKQAAAAVGQNLLMQAYAEAFSHHGLVTAQLLLTRQDFMQEEHYKNAYNTMDELIKRGVIPVINENDSTAVEELTFGDNDMLSALVSGCLHADQLIILTDIDGIYKENPNTNPGAEKYDSLSGVPDEVIKQAEGSSSKVGTGGMKSKLEAARTAHSMGVPVFIGKAQKENQLVNIISGDGSGTYLSPPGSKMMKNTKQWIAFHSLAKGKIYIDQGAEAAVLTKGKSILPVGITSVEGAFNSRDVVDVYNLQGRLIGRGKINFDADKLKELINRRNRLNGKRCEAIHRDQWISVE
ncbi:glutamate 5-kinase [Salipaludibacillus sp. CUR1]|uniref:glutamate 5-kinase n=1 Tax=Salipaludibacillus sp. CUR1 TaxID=2820003 RepID=UPI001E4170FD|nr:glutamate 5-kinase [Salipaludibacillus sp. CUR1]MCE7791945.1 glutamate 5-kinase [Salipaludibacillus sp. CUR1]